MAYGLWFIYSYGLNKTVDGVGASGHEALVSGDGAETRASLGVVC